jgi:hypothetical protein
MSYSEDAWTAERLEKLRMLALIIAFGLLALSLVLDMPWLHWPRGLAWAAAGIASIYEGRAYKRMGRDPDSAYLRGVLCIIVGVVCVL